MQPEHKAASSAGMTRKQGRQPLWSVHDVGGEGILFMVFGMFVFSANYPPLARIAQAFKCRCPQAFRSIPENDFYALTAPLQ
jgi:hypothetical protein